jgi:hypothetical protein
LIASLAKDIDAALSARKYPVRVVYGPEHLARPPHAGQPLIVFERDRESGDGVRPVKGARGTERAMRVRELGVIVTVYAASSAASARTEEHEHACDQIVDALIVALDEWFVEGKTGRLCEYSESRMMNAEEFEDAHFRQWPGCAYRIRFDLPRGVRALNYTPPREHAPGTLPGEARPTATVERFDGGEVHLRRQGAGPETPPEVVDIPGDPVDP